MEKILIIDDEREIVETLENFLNSKGYQTVRANFLKEAEEQIKKHDPFLVLLDIKLPDGSGINFLKKIKQEYPTIEVIMVTGLSEKEIALQSLEFGAADYICKPIDLKYLSDSVLAKVISTYQG